MTKSNTTGTPTREETLTPTELQRRVEDHPFLDKLFGGEPSAHSVRNLEGRETLPTLTALNPEDSNNLVNLGPFSQEAAVQAGTKVRVLVFEPLDNEQDIRMEIVLKQIPDIGFTFRDKARIAEVLRDHYKPLAKQSQGSKGNNFGRWNEAVADHFPAPGNKPRPDWWWGQTNIHKSLYIWDRRPGGRKSDTVPEGLQERAERLLTAIEGDEKSVGPAYKELHNEVENGQYGSNNNGNSGGSGNSDSDTDDDGEGDDNERESGEFNNTPLSARTLLPNGKVRKTPVVGSELMHSAQEYWVNNQGIQTDDKPLDWWTPEGIVDPYHPYVLINPITSLNGIRNSIQQQAPVWQVLRLDRDEHFVIADSGGFQLQSRDDIERVESAPITQIRQGTISPDGVLRWQIKNADAGMILDVAPSTVDGDSYLDRFRKGLNETKRYAETAITEQHAISPDTDWRTLQPEDFLLYGVIHGKPDALSGKTYESYKRWYEGLTTDLEFDGWAFGELGGLSDIALCLAFAGEYIEADRIHLLGAKGLHQRVLMRYFTELYPETTVTHDTSRGSKRGAALRRLKSSLQYDAEYRHGHGDNHAAYATMPCGCSVCERVETDIGGQTFAECGGSIFGSIPTLHNHQMQQPRLREVDAYVEEQGRTLLDQFADNDVSTVAGTPDRKLPDLDLEGDLWTHLDTNPQARGKLRELYYALRFLTESHDDGLDTACERWQFDPLLKRTELRQSVIQPSESTKENPFA